MHLGCNPLGILNINMKNLKPWATRQPASKTLWGVTLPSADLSLQQHHKITQWTCCRQQIIYASCPTCPCISLICLPFHKDMHGDSHQGIPTQHGFISTAMELPAACRSLHNLWSETAQSLHNLQPQGQHSPASRGTAPSSELLPKPSTKN